MNLVHCKCGKSSMNFEKLSQKDFGVEGLELDCCKDIQEMMELQGLSEPVPAEEAKEEPKAIPAPKAKKKQPKPEPKTE